MKKISFFRRLKGFLWGSISFSIILTGCVVGPDYRSPENNVPYTWSSLDPCIIDSQADICAIDFLNDPIIQWWEQFRDPLLNEYIARAAAYNNDVLTATSTILQARALRQVAAASFFPQIGLDTNATRTYFSKNGPLFAIGPSIGSVPGTISPVTGLPFSVQIPQIQNLYNFLFDASWEIDLFGKTSRTVEAADAIIGRTIEERNDTLISVIAELARNYIELRSYQEKARLIEEDIALLEKKSFLLCKQLEAGYINRLEEEKIEASLATDRAKLPGIQAQIYRSIFILSTLTGALPEALVTELLPIQPLPQPPEIVSVGLRSDLLRRRPDIRRSERDLAAATANIGVAVAAFFPTFTLVGDGGFQSLMLSNLFSLGSKTWSIGADLNMPIFEGGRLKGNLKAKCAETAATAYTYQQIVLNALGETESAIVSYTHDLETVCEKKVAVERYQELTFLSAERNLKGLTNLIDLLDAERQLNEAQQTLLDSETIALLDLIFLYKALGGGWET